jgi:hypothetical protein
MNYDYLTRYDNIPILKHIEILTYERGLRMIKKKHSITKCYALFLHLFTFQTPIYKLFYIIIESFFLR